MAALHPDQESMGKSNGQEVPASDCPLVGPLPCPLTPSACGVKAIIPQALHPQMIASGISGLLSGDVWRPSGGRAGADRLGFDEKGEVGWSAFLTPALVRQGQDQALDPQRGMRNRPLGRVL